MAEAAGDHTDLAISARDVEAAAARLAGVAHRTPVLRSRTLDRQVGGQLFLKAENLQRVGAFKFRGAYNAVASLAPAVRQRGIVAFSSGNHAQAVALAAALHEVPATILMPEDAPRVKLAATRGYGAEVVTYDRYGQDRAALGATLAEERGAVVIPPYDHRDVMAGQGTVARELLEEVPDLDVLVVPVGGGGLISGCAVAARDARPGIEVFGVEPASRRAARDALARGEVVEVPVPRTILDGQQTPNVGAQPLAVMRRLVDRVVGIEDKAVVDAMRLLFERLKLVVEPSGASALAAVLAGDPAARDRRVGVVLSGGNIDLDRFCALTGTAASGTT